MACELLPPQDHGADLELELTWSCSFYRQHLKGGWCSLPITYPEKNQSSEYIQFPLPGVNHFHNASRSKHGTWLPSAHLSHATCKKSMRTQASCRESLTRQSQTSQNPHLPSHRLASPVSRFPLAGLFSGILVLILFSLSPFLVPRAFSLHVWVLSFSFLA